jgi:hypothetical protein
MAATEPRLVMSIYSEHIVQSHHNMCHFGCPVSATTFTHTYHPDICVHIRPAILYTDLDRLLPKVEFNACNRDTQTFYSPHLPTRLDRVHLDMFWPHRFGLCNTRIMNTSNLVPSHFFLPSPQSMDHHAWVPPIRPQEENVGIASYTINWTGASSWSPIV